MKTRIHPKNGKLTNTTEEQTRNTTEGRSRNDRSTSQLRMLRYQQIQERGKNQEKQLKDDTIFYQACEKSQISRARHRPSDMYKNSKRGEADPEQSRKLRAGQHRKGVYNFFFFMRHKA